MVSFIILTHNRLEKTRTLVESLLHYAGSEEYELVFVDDGSADGTVEYVAALPRSRIVAFAQEVFNYHAALNAGVPHAKGDVLGFLINDIELLTPGIVPRVENILRRNPLIGILSPVEVTGSEAEWRGREEAPALHLPRGYTVWCWGGGVFMRRETWEAMGGFDESYTGYGFVEAEQGMCMLKLGLRVAWGGLAAAHHHGPGDNAAYHSAEGLVANCLRFHEKHGGDLEFGSGPPMDNIYSWMAAYLWRVFQRDWQRRETRLALGVESPVSEGFVRIGLPGTEGVDLEWDLTQEIPWMDSTVDEIRVGQVWDRVAPNALLEEAYRVLKPGGVCRISLLGLPERDGEVPAAPDDLWSRLVPTSAEESFRARFEVHRDDPSQKDISSPQASLRAVK